MDVDLLIRGGTVVDGTGAPGVVADVAVRDGRIAAVGTLPDAAAATVIEAAGRIVAPGFIDAHPHSETALRGNGEIWGSVLQGVTSHLTGPDGFGWAPLPAEACAELWRATAFAYGQPDLRAGLADHRCLSRRLRRDDPAQRRADGAAPADPLRGHGLGRSPADAGGDGPDARPHARLDGGRRGRAQHRARLPAGRQRVHGRDRRAGQGRRRVRRRVRGPHPLQRDRQAGRLPRVDRDRQAAPASPSGSRTSRSTTRPSRCSRRPARPASTSASTGTCTPRGRATCSSGCRRRTSSAASTRRSSGSATTRPTGAKIARDHRGADRGSPTPSAAASTSRTRGPGATSGCPSARSRRSAARASARRRST